MKKYHTFKVYGFGEELNWAEISANIAKRIINSGITEDFKDELILDSESGITSDITIEVDGKSIEFDLNSLDQNIVIKKWNAGTAKKWYFLEVFGLQGLFYETVINGSFDIKKITLQKESYQVGNVALEQIFYSIRYDGQECIEDFDFSDRKFKSASYYVLSPRGEIFEVEITDDDGEDSEDLEGTNFIEENIQAKRLYVFKDKKSFDNFNKWIESDLKPRISEGLDDISGIHPVVKGKNRYEVLLIGKKIDLLSLPEPHLPWVKAEIGKFTIEDN